jgi:hypothetical protein
MTDTYTETATKGWSTRIGESIKGILFGIVLIVLSCMLLFWNEGRAVQTTKSLNEGAGLVVDVGPGSVDPANEGKLVHVTGDMKAGVKPNDAEFGVSPDSLRLERKVEMYQWKQESKEETKKNLGGSEETVTTYSYAQEWSESPIDSRKFKVPDGHFNPAMRYQSAQFKGGNITFGAFRPNDDVVAMLPASEQVRVDAAMAEALRARVSGPVQAVDGRFYLGADPSAPRIGDMRVSYRAVPVGAVSIVGRQSGSDFADYQTHAGDKLLIVKPGTKSAIEMFNAAQSKNKMWTWIIRIVGAAMMFVGFQLIFAPLVVVADVVPMIGNVLGAGASLVSFIATAVLAPLVIAIAWLWYRPLVSIIVLAVGGALAFGGYWWRARHKAVAHRAAPESTTAAPAPRPS